MKKSIIVLLFAISILISCNRGSYFSDSVQGLNYQKYDTYAWLPNPDTSIEGYLIDNEILIQNIRNAADREMQARGYTLNVENPDLLLLTHTLFERRQELIRSAPLYSSYGYYHPGFYTGPMHPFYYNRFYTMPFISGFDIQQVDYTEGSLVIDVIERETNRLIWRGWMEKRIDNPDRFQKNINDYVSEIFEEFPVEQK